MMFGDVKVYPRNRDDVTGFVREVVFVVDGETLFATLSWDMWSGYAFEWDVDHGFFVSGDWSDDVLFSLDKATCGV